MKKFREKTKNMRKRLISFVLALSIVIQTLVIGLVALPVAFAADAETPAAGSPSAKVNNVYTESGISYKTSKELTYQGDRTYKLSLTATSSLREAHQTEVRTLKEDGFFTVSAQGSGYYLLELYGGDGGVGATTARGGDGVGGQGGYAYGYIWLDEGDTLVYTIGTIGDSTVYAGEDGSGENNDDAGHGDNGSYAVGAGGGFSAIYLIKGDNGQPQYVQPAEGFVTEEYRRNNYIMIAGGGGGGGAGNGALELSTGNANGGAGGTVAAGGGIHLTADENAANGGVAGTYYSGSDGETSGHKYWVLFGYIDDTSYEYVGVGGTNVPGVPKSGAFDLFDWFATSPAQYWWEGGAGSAGNFRGGGGGAGFAGGSGGTMQGALLTKNVGGGGGGSSFIADAVTAFDVDKVDEDIKSLLLGPGGNDNPTGSGGKAVITFIGADPTTMAFTDHLADVEINGDISKYFDVVDVRVNNGEFTDNVASLCTVNADGTTSVKVEHANITPDRDGYEDADNFCQVDIIIKAKSDFFGGNKVPILAGLDGVFENGDNGENFTFTTAETTYQYDYEDPITGQHVTGTKPFDHMTFRFAGAKDANSYLQEDGGNYYKYRDWCDFVNVDLNLEASGNSHAFTTKTYPKPVDPAILYNDIYGDYRADMSQFESSYLEIISDYVVMEQGSSTELSEIWLDVPQQVPTEGITYYYTVGYYVTALVNAADAAIVGPVVKDRTFIRDTAIIIIIKSDDIIIGDKDGELDNAALTVDKMLSYDSNTNLYKLRVSLSGDYFYNDHVRYAYYIYRDSSEYDTGAAQGSYNAPEKNRYVAPVSGWYAIGVRGGQGGDGHGAYYGSVVGTDRHAGGYGAFGDDVTGYVYLEAGDELTWYLGDDNIQWNREHKHVDSCAGFNRKRTGITAYESGKGGLGGECSWIALQKQGAGAYTPLIIAAGGAGGGGAEAHLNGSNNGASNTAWESGQKHGSIAGIDVNTSIHTDGLSHYNGGNGEDANGDKRQHNAGTQPNSFINSNYVVQTLNSTSAATVKGINNEQAVYNGTELATPSFMDEDPNVNGGKVKKTLCGNSLESNGTGTPESDEAEYKVSGMSISLVYADKEGVQVGTNWNGSYSIDPGKVDSSDYWTVEGNYWTHKTNGSATDKVNDAASTKGYYDDLGLNIEFDKYFELESFVFDPNGGNYEVTKADFDGSEKNIDDSGTTKLTYSVSQAYADKTTVDLPYIDYDGASYAYIEPGAERWQNTVYFMANLEDVTFDFYLKPADGFVGGNDVPLLLLLGSKCCDKDPSIKGGGNPKMGVDDMDTEYAGLSVTIKNDPLDPLNNGGRVTRYVSEFAISDYANVAINYDFNSDNFSTKQGLVLECGAEIDDIKELIEEDEKGLIDRFPDYDEQMKSDKAWLWDYAVPKTARDVFGDSTIDGSIYKQSAFTLQQQVAPKIETAQKAVVIASVGPATAENIVTVSVERPVKEELQFITSEYYTSIDGFTAVTDEEGNVTGYKAKTEADISGKLTADKGYNLPAKEDVIITVCGIQLTDFEYDQSTGAFTISASAVIALLDENHANVPDGAYHSIIIKATATPDMYELSFVWWDENGAESSDFAALAAYIKEQTGKDIDVSAIVSAGTAKKFEVGETLTDDEWFELFVALDRLDLGDHKEFKWSWGTDSEKPLETMPGVNTKIPGYISDKTYYVKVHYILQGDDTKTDLIEPTEITGRYGASEMVTAPAIRGYVPVEASKLVTIEEDGSGEVITDVYIEYVEAAGQLYVYHAKSDTGENIAIDGPFDITINEVNAGSMTVGVTVQDVPHYTAKYDGAEVTDSITVEITEDDLENGKAVYIYYYPDQYKVIFDGNSIDDDVVFKATDKTERTVEYNNSFGYDADDAKTAQFPQPERKGYTFLGWFTEDGTQIFESTMITAQNDELDALGIQTYEPTDGEDITLYAHWKVAEYSVIVNYTVLDKDGTPIEFGSTYWPAELPDSRVVTPVEYTKDYAIDILNPVGFERFGDITRADNLPVEYSDDGTKLTGQMLLSNIVYNITYKQQTYKLTVNFEWDPTMATTDLPDLPASIVKDGDDKLVYNETYSFTRAELEGGELNELLKDYKIYVSGDNGEQISSEDILSGKMPAGDTVITVYYTESFVETVEISLYDFYFKLSDVEYNAGTHNYEGSTLEKAFADEYYNIDVAVNSKNDKTVSFEYAPEAYGDILVGSFNGNKGTHKYNVDALDSDSVQTKFDLNIADGKTVAVPEAEDFKSGKVIVKVSDKVSDKEGVEEP